MPVTGLHLLLTFRCILECDHCFVWGSPRSKEAMSLDMIGEILAQAQEMNDCQWIYFEGGEPFLFYPVLLSGVQAAAGSGFKVGIVSNAYWATSTQDALECLRPFQGLIEDLSISTDLYHGTDPLSRESLNAKEAATGLNIPCELISIQQPGQSASCSPVLESTSQYRLMYKGRAAALLAHDAALIPWNRFTDCPYEDLEHPTRLHIDPYGNLHVCQGILIGNLFEMPIGEICAGYSPELHPVIGPLVRGGPAAMARNLDVAAAGEYADACHLCYETRRSLLELFPRQLGPREVYGGE